MAITQAQKKASEKYHKSHIRQIKFAFSIQYDADILARLDSVQNKQGYIKELIRADIARNSVIAEVQPSYAIIDRGACAIIQALRDTDSGAVSGAFFAGYDEMGGAIWVEDAAEALVQLPKYAAQTIKDLEAAD